MPPYDYCKDPKKKVKYAVVQLDTELGVIQDAHLADLRRRPDNELGLGTRADPKRPARSINRASKKSLASSTASVWHKQKEVPHSIPPSVPCPTARTQQKSFFPTTVVKIPATYHWQTMQEKPRERESAMTELPTYGSLPAPTQSAAEKTLKWSGNQHENA